MAQNQLLGISFFVDGTKLHEDLVCLTLVYFAAKRWLGENHNVTYPVSFRVLAYISAY